MGKHKNIDQTKMLLNFMECHQDIARGYVKGDKVAVESLWRELAEQLNSAGPPSKNVSEWKKNWADWKAVVKKKMYHNKRENKKTGGGEYNQYVLTDLEESMSRICGFYKSVDGIAGVKTFGEPDVEDCMNILCDSGDNIETICENSSGESEPDKENEDIDFTPSTSNRIYAQTSSANNGSFGSSAHSKRSIPVSPHTPDPKRAKNKTARFTDPDRERNGNKSSASYTPHQNPATSVTSRQLSPTRTTPCSAATLNVAANTKATPKINRLSTPSNPDLKSLLCEENKCLETICKLLEDQRNETKFLNDKLERLCNILEKKYKDDQLHNIEIQKRLCEKNEMKLKLIDLEVLRLNIDKENRKI